MTLGPALEVSERAVLMPLIRTLRTAARDEGCSDVVVELLQAVELEVSSDALGHSTSPCVGHLRIVQRTLGQRNELLGEEAGELARAVEVAVGSGRASTGVRALR